jgi:hypothetical protein
MDFHTLQWTQVRLTWTSGSTPYKRDIGSHKIQLGRSEYSEYSLYCNFSEYIRHIRYPFPANMPTQFVVETTGWLGLAANKFFNEKLILTQETDPTQRGCSCRAKQDDFCHTN